MRFTLGLSCDNSAFEPDEYGDEKITDGMRAEVARILRELADGVENEEGEEEWSATLRDMNGNRCGGAGFTQ